MTRIGVTGHQNILGNTRRMVAAELASVILSCTDDDLVGYTSLAEGADQLFAFAILAAGGQVHAVIPSASYEASFQSTTGRNTYTALLSLASAQEQLPHQAPTEDAYLAAGHEVVNCADVLLAVWDGAGAAGKGGTGDVVEYAETQGVEVRVIWPPGSRRG